MIVDLLDQPVMYMRALSGLRLMLFNLGMIRVLILSTIKQSIFTRNVYAIIAN